MFIIQIFKTFDIFSGFLFQYAITVLCYVRTLVYFNLFIACFSRIHFNIGIGCLCYSHDENHGNFSLFIWIKFVHT